VNLEFLHTEKRKRDRPCPPQIWGSERRIFFSLRLWGIHRIALKAQTYILGFYPNPTEHDLTPLSHGPIGAWKTQLRQKFLAECPTFWYGAKCFSNHSITSVNLLRNDWSADPRPRREILTPIWTITSRPTTPDSAPTPAEFSVVLGNVRLSAGHGVVVFA
jgi:hypothetical protein